MASRLSHCRKIFRKQLMKIATSVWKKFPILCLKYFDFAVIVVLLISLRHCYIYEKTVLSSSENQHWWRWPVYKGWSILGKVPEFDDYDNEFDPKKLKHRSPELVKYPPKPNPSEMKLILFHHVPMEDISHNMNPGLCGGECRIAYNDSSHSQANEADAVVFTMDFPKVLPERRFPSQLYVWMTLESPSSTLYSQNKPEKEFFYKNYKDSFNLTMTYRRDSDVYLPYNTSYAIHTALLKKQPDYKSKDFLLEKTKLTAWANSNCGFTKGSSFRSLMVIKLLKAGLKLDIYGKCVMWQLPGRWTNIAEHLKVYKFFLSFENAFHCRDYITEKTWWNALSTGVVPVIWGPTRSDVEAVLPAKSFIFVEDFNTEQELVDYLNYLDKNDDRYLKFFEWRFKETKLDITGRKHERKPRLQSSITGLCQLCHILHHDDQHYRDHGTRPRRVVKSIYNWWYLQETKTCLSPYIHFEKSYGLTYHWLLFTEVWLGGLTYLRFYSFVQSLVLVVLVIRRFK